MMAAAPPMNQEEAARPRRATYTVWILFVVAVLNIVDRQVINVLADPISKELQLTDTQIGLLTGLAFAVFYNLSSIPLGRFADRPSTNRSHLIAGSLAVWSAATALCAAAGNYAHLVTARIAVAASEAGCTPPAHSLIADRVPLARRARALAIFGLGVPVGALIGKAGGGILAEAVGWRSAFLIVGLPGIVLAVIFFATVREPRREKDYGARVPMSFGKAFRLFARSPALLWMSAGTASAMLLVTGGSVWGMIHFLRNHELDTATAGVWLGLSGGIAGVTGTWLGGWTADKFGRDRPALYMLPAMIGMLLSVPLLFFAWKSQNWHFAIILLFLPDMFDNMYYGGTFAAIQSLVPEEMRATATAFFLFTTTMIGTGLGALSFGAVSDFLQPWAQGSESVQWVLMGAALLYSVPAFCYWRASRALSRELQRPDGSAGSVAIEVPAAG